MAPKLSKFASAAGKKVGSPKKGGSPGKGSPGKGFSGRLSGKFKAASKDTRHKMWIQGLDGGMFVVWLSKHSNDNEGAFLHYDNVTLQADEELMESFGLNAIIDRKGADGDTPLMREPGSTYPWLQCLFVCGAEENTVQGRRALVMPFLSWMNENAKQPNYRYPRKIRLAGDISHEPLLPPSAALLNRHVVGLLIRAFPDMTLEDMKGDEDIMLTFFGDVEVGQSAVEASGVEFNDGDSDEENVLGAEAGNDGSGAEEGSDGAALEVSDED